MEPKCLSHRLRSSSKPQIKDITSPRFDLHLGFVPETFMIIEGDNVVRTY